MMVLSVLQTAIFLVTAFALFNTSCGQDTSIFYITANDETSCGHDRTPCLTLDQFTSEDIYTSTAIILLPGDHKLSRNIEIFNVSHLYILGDSISQNLTSRVQCTSPASFLFEGIFSLEIRNIVIVSCGGTGNTFGTIEVSSVNKLDISNVTVLESTSVSVTLNVQNSNGLVTEAMFVGNAGVALQFTNASFVFEGNNTFSGNLDSAIASYDSTLVFNGVNQFTNNRARTGGGLLAVRSTIHNNGFMTFEGNTAEYGGGLYASATRMTSNRFS